MSTLRRTAPPAPVRIVHLGIGNFARAHMAWYTARSSDADQWGIAAFTGRRPDIAHTLSAQDCLYHLITRHADRDQVEVIDSLSAVHAADDHAAWLGYFRRPEVTIVTSTVTEAGYRRDATGALDLSDQAVAADIATLRADIAAPVTTAPAKFVAGLAARCDADAGPITFLPCDNVPDNGAMVARVIADLAGRVDPELAAWIEANTAYASCMVDRITPRTIDTGVDDPAAVVTEPFAEWVISGDFAHPQWPGARFVDDISPYEHRKLRLLNGSHTLMAYAGSALGHASVVEAINDPLVLGWVEEYWDEAARTLPLAAEDITAYRDALLDRYRNPRIRHLLAQIAADGSQKIAIRIVPTIRQGQDEGWPTPGALRAVAAWIVHLRGVGAPVTDPQAEDLQALASGQDGVLAVLGWLGLGDDLAEATSELVDEVLVSGGEGGSSGR